MPPAPIRAVTSYWPRRVPGLSGTALREGRDYTGCCRVSAGRTVEGVPGWNVTDAARSFASAPEIEDPMRCSGTAGTPATFARIRARDRRRLASTLPAQAPFRRAHRESMPVQRQKRTVDATATRGRQGL